MSERQQREVRRRQRAAHTEKELLMLEQLIEQRREIGRLEIVILDRCCNCGVESNDKADHWRHCFAVNMIDSA